RHSSSLPYSVQVKHALLRFHRALRGVSTRGYRGRNDQYRDAVCVTPGVYRGLDSARAAARSAARIQGAGGAVRFDGWCRHLRCDDLRPRLDELVAADRLAADRPGHLIQLWAEAQQSASAERGRSRTEPRAFDGGLTAVASRQSPVVSKTQSPADDRRLSD